MSPRDQAVQLLQFYMRRAWEEAGLRWEGDHDAELEILVDAIIDAAREPA